MKIHGHRKGTDTCNRTGSQDPKGAKMIQESGDDKGNGFQREYKFSSC